jgi:hypothetical protein
LAGSRLAERKEGRFGSSQQKETDGLSVPNF